MIGSISARKEAAEEASNRQLMNVLEMFLKIFSILDLIVFTE